jgi:hypothetical protein
VATANEGISQERNVMKRTILPTFAAALLSAAGIASAAGQTYNPYVTTDIPESSTARGKKGTQSTGGSGAPNAYGSYRLVFPTTKSDPRKRRLRAR